MERYNLGSETKRSIIRIMSTYGFDYKLFTCDSSYAARLDQAFFRKLNPRSPDVRSFQPTLQRIRIFAEEGWYVHPDNVLRRERPGLPAQSDS